MEFIRESDIITRITLDFWKMNTGCLVEEWVLPPKIKSYVKKGYIFTTYSKFNQNIEFTLSNKAQKKSQCFA